MKHILLRLLGCAVIALSLAACAPLGPTPVAATAPAQQYNGQLPSYSHMFGDPYANMTLAHPVVDEDAQP